jgi:hypothetical protein
MDCLRTKFLLNLIIQAPPRQGGWKMEAFASRWMGRSLLPLPTKSFSTVLRHLSLTGVFIRDQVSEHVVKDSDEYK